MHLSQLNINSYIFILFYFIFDSHIPNPRTLYQIVIPLNKLLWTQHFLKLGYNQQSFEELFLTPKLFKFSLL
jgi:hypothetical protein